MKYLILVGDGMADHPLPELQGKTPLEAAKTPGLDAMAHRGVLGLFCPIPEGMPAGSEIGNLSLFGYDPRSVFRGRAPLEAANQGIQLGPQDVAFRCNLVTLQDGQMHDFTSGHISSAEGAEIIATLNETLAKDFPIRFSPGVGYRHLAIVTAGADPSLDDFIHTDCTPPHNIMDRAYAPHLPKGGAGSLVQELMQRSEAILRDHPVNQARRERGEAVATSIWLWGQGTAPAMESYDSLYQRTGAVVSAVDLVNGIGRIAGFEVLDVPGMTGWIDTNYQGKVAAALEALERCDLAFIHIEAPDETSHQGRADLKIQAIEDYDREVVQVCLAYLDSHPDTRLLAAPDHFTLVSTKGHAPGPVPFAVCGAGIEASMTPAYTEREAEKSGILIEEGYQLVAQFLTAPAMAFPRPAQSEARS